MKISNAGDNETRVQRTTIQRSKLNWVDAETLVCPDVFFEVNYSSSNIIHQSTPEKLILAKSRHMIEYYENLFANFDIRNIFDIGIFKGGSIVFFYELVRPKKIVGIDIEPTPNRALKEFILKNGLEDVLRPIYNIDQANAQAVHLIVEQEFRGEPIDLIVDDGCHYLDETRATFNTLFQYLRNGGLYVIEDWGWAHWPGIWQENGGPWKDRPATTSFIFELIMLAASRPDLIEKIEILHDLAVIQKGKAQDFPGGFNVSESYLSAGRTFLELTASVPRPRVSVIVPVYNGAKTVAEALQSVFAQSYKDYEVIVVNDGSTDSSTEVVDGFGDKIRLISLDQNGGQSAARNLGAAQARGEYLAFLDQDDVWYPHKLEWQVAVLNENPEVGLVYSDLDEIDREGRYKTLEVHKAFGMTHPKTSLVWALINDLFILPSTVVCRKECFGQVGGFDTRLSGYEDDDLWVRLWPVCRFHYIPKALTKWRIHLSSSSETSLMEKSRTVFFQKLMDTYGGDPYMRSVVTQRCYSVYKTRGTQLIRRGEARRARLHYLNALRTRPDALMLLRLACTFVPAPVFRYVDGAWRKLKHAEFDPP